MKTLKKYIFIFFIGALISVIAIYWTDIRSILRPSRTPQPTLLLDSIHKISKLQISELIQQYVFPHDFIKSEEELRYITEKRKQNRSLSSKELLQWEAYQLARQTKLYTSQWDTFVVVTLRIHVGVDFNGDDSLSVETFSIDANAKDNSEDDPNNYSDEERRGVKVHLPAVQILNIEIQDLHKETYPYPPVQLDANQWKQVSNFVEREARFRVQESDFLSRSEESKQELIRNMLVLAGFKEIVFQ